MRTQEDPASPGKSNQRLSERQGQIAQHPWEGRRNALRRLGGVLALSGCASRESLAAPPRGGEAASQVLPQPIAQAAASTARADPTSADGATKMHTQMHTRPIPSSGEQLPVIGCGTYVGFDVEPGSAAYAELPGVLQALFDAGGSVLDSSPMYGRAETSVGELLETSPVRHRAFVATKVWTSSRERGIAQMSESMKRLKAEPIDLMQIHNLVDWQTHLATLKDWKREGRIRYIGISHYTRSAYQQVEAVMREHPLDFVQLNYSIDEREAEARLLPLAAELGIAVIVNRPFGGGGLLGKLAKRPLPDWAGELGCRSWAQILLKFVVGHPAVTCAIPGTGKAAHMRDNAAAGAGPLPDVAMRKRMAAEWL